MQTILDGLAIGLPNLAPAGIFGRDLFPSKNFSSLFNPSVSKNFSLRSSLNEETSYISSLMITPGFSFPCSPNRINFIDKNLNCSIEVGRSYQYHPKLFRLYI